MSNVQVLFLHCPFFRVLNFFLTDFTILFRFCCVFMFCKYFFYFFLFVVCENVVYIGCNLIELEGICQCGESCTHPFDYSNKEACEADNKPGQFCLKSESASFISFILKSALFAWGVIIPASVINDTSYKCPL